MKNLFTFIVIFGLGVASYAFLQNFLSQKEKVATDASVATSTPLADTDIEEDSLEDTMQAEDTITLAPDGTQLDGPFILMDKDGEEAGGTVQIIRSPEEILLQFEDLESEHSPDAHIYFADDRTASEYLDLGPAKINGGDLIYGVPLDASLQNYSYILVFDRLNGTAEYYAKVR